MQTAVSDATVNLYSRFEPNTVKCEQKKNQSFILRHLQLMKTFFFPREYTIDLISLINDFAIKQKSFVDYLCINFCNKSHKTVTAFTFLTQRKQNRNVGQYN